MDPATGRGTRRPSPDFEIRLVGHQVKPWDVPMRALARTLNAVQRLMEPTTEEGATKQDKEAAISIMPLHLIDVKSGSARYAVSANDPERTIRTLTEAGLALENPGAQEWDLDLLSLLRT